MGEEDIDYPEVGEQRNGHILVARGDDWPEEIEGWLGDLLHSYGELVCAAQEADIDLGGIPLSDSWNDETDPTFAQRAFAGGIGIDMDSKFWEGDHISANYQFWWLPAWGSECNEGWQAPLG